MRVKFKIIKITALAKETRQDSVVREIRLILIVNGKELTTLLCSPCDLEDLARGLLFSSGLIKANNAVKEINIDKKKYIAYLKLTQKTLSKQTCTCKGAAVISTLAIPAAKITALMDIFLKSSPVYAQTGGTHSAAIANADTIDVLREDIGRHNAIDKVIGWGLNNNCDFTQKILLTSGRVSLEVILKMEKCRIPIVISKSAPTDEAIKRAKTSHITLVGFVRANSMNVYSYAGRIT